MKIPKVLKRFCKNCKAHTEHKVTMAKRKGQGSATPLGKFAKSRTDYGKGTGNLGRYGSRPAIGNFKMAGKKVTKKVDRRFECTKCKKMSVQSKGLRTKKAELV